VVIITAEAEWEKASAVEVMSSAEAAGLDRLEEEAVSVAVASTQQPRHSVACKDPLEWEHAEAELASACRVIGDLSTLMDELPAL
jgi:hypothetical protein